MAKSFLIAVLLWFTLGTFGVHHLYLRRDAHFLLTILTLGGFFGMGWYRDLYHLKRYVHEANLEPQFVKKMTDVMSDYAVPPFSTTRFSASMIAGAWFAYIAAFAVPSDDTILSPVLQQCIKFALVPAALALGVFLVGNIGWQCGPLKAPLIASYLSFVVFHATDACISYASIIAALAFEFNAKRWKVPRAPFRQVSSKKRIARITVALVVYSVLVLSALYFNAKLNWPPEKNSGRAATTGRNSTNSTIPFFEAMKRAYKSPMLRNMLLELTVELNKARTSSWSDLYKRLQSLSGKADLNRAYKVLGVNKSASKKEITAAYRKLARLYHPDKHRQPDLKRQAQEKFIEIQWAHELLTGGRGKSARSTPIDGSDVERAKKGEF